MQKILVSNVITLIVTILTSIITSKVTLKKDVKRIIRDKREEIYIELYDILQNLLDNPYLVFNAEAVFGPLKRMRTKLKFYASKSIINATKELYQIIGQTYLDYEEFIEQEHLVEEMERLRGIEDFRGIEELEQYKDDYMKAHFIKEDFLYLKIEEIVKRIRKDLYTK